MKTVHNIILATAASVFPLWAMAQNTLTGRITDNVTGEPLVGASVIVRGAKSEGVVTDADGRFTYTTTKDAPLTLSIAYIGYQPLEVEVYDPEEPVDIKLREKRDLLNEVVVIGYGTQQRNRLTGSVTTVKADALKNTQQPTVESALSGMVAGLNVTAASGQPGDASSIRIRGGNSVNASNEPLYVVDGFIYFKDDKNSDTGLGAISSSLDPLSTINPQDIESVEVLKDVSATAVYGSRGANGVIIITTKKGRRGQKKANITYGYSLGVSSITKKLDLMNASEWAQYQKTYWNNKGGYTDKQIAVLGEGTDWQDAVLRHGIQQQHELSITGATDKSRYAFSANYTDQDGIVLNTNFQRYNFHTNLEWELLPGLQFGVSATYGRSKQNGLTTTVATNYNSSPYSAGITNSFVYALLMPPVISIYNADGSYNFTNPYEYSYFAIGDHAANPVYDLKESVAENIDNYLLSNVWATYKLSDFLLKVSVGLNSEKLTQNYFSGAYTALGLATAGIGGIANKQSDIWQQEYTLTYTHDFGRAHHVEAMAGFTRQSSKTTYNESRTSNFTNETLKQNNLGDGSEVYTPISSLTKSTLSSIIARVNYTLLERYNLTATYRADNSSRFAANHRWGYFPSLGLSWNIDREPWLKRARHLDYLKLRLSGGLVGNQEIPDYAYATSYSTGSYGGSSSYTRSTTVNSNLKWETTASYNVGVDAGFWNGRLSVVADAYYKKTRDLLLLVPTGFSSGVSTQLQNVGNVVNKGVELTVNTQLINTKKLQWSVSGNIAHNHNEITSMGSSDNIIQGSDKQQILRVGEALGSFYGLKFDGIVQSGEDVSSLPTVNGITPKAGDVKYVDTNNDHRIDGNDRQVLGSIQPDFTYGLSSQLQWGAFDAQVVFAGSHGAKLYNALGRRLEQTGDSYNVLTTVLDSWTADNGGDRLPLASTTRAFSYIDSRYVQSASYLKLRNLTIGYRLPLPKAFPVGIRLYATASNLFTITPYKGYDPEVSSGTDNGAYPASRTFTFGVNVTL